MRLDRTVSFAALVGLIGACTDAPPAMDRCGEVLPEEGSLCPKDGEVCAPDRDGCGLYRGLRCDAGVWISFEVGTGRCEVASETGGDTELAPVACGDEVPPDGTPCLQEGEDCAPDPDVCAGYVGAQCSEGMWMRYEVGAGDPDTCGSSSSSGGL